VVEPDTSPDAELLTEPNELPPRQLRLVALVALGVVAFDQLTKWLAVRTLSDGPMHLIGSLRLNLLHNTGVAFSMGSGRGVGPVISLLAVGVIVAISLGHTSRFRLGAVAAGLIAGGALGNLIDRAFRGGGGLLHGAVVDFVDLQWWPVFNAADAAIVVGAILLGIAALIAEPV
jgi:signal peptidase II